MKNEQQKLKEIDVELGEIELPQIDVKPYVGRRVKIDNVKTLEGSRFGNIILRIQTEIVETVEGGKRPIEIRGSRIFGIHEDANGNMGWSPQTKLGQFLKRMKAKKPDDLIGQEVTLQVQPSTSGGADFLTFI